MPQSSHELRNVSYYDSSSSSSEDRVERGVEKENRTHSSPLSATDASWIKSNSNQSPHHLTAKQQLMNKNIANSSSHLHGVSVGTGSNNPPHSEALVGIGRSLVKSSAQYRRHLPSSRSPGRPSHFSSIISDPGNKFCHISSLHTLYQHFPSTHMYVYVVTPKPKSFFPPNMTTNQVQLMIPPRNGPYLKAVLTTAMTCYQRIVVTINLMTTLVRYIPLRDYRNGAIAC